MSRYQFKKYATGASRPPDSFIETNIPPDWDVSWDAVFDSINCWDEPVDIYCLREPWGGHERGAILVLGTHAFWLETRPESYLELVEQGQSAQTTASEAGCQACPALCAGRTSIVEGYGPADPVLMVVGEAPGASEDRAAMPFVGQSGTLLRAVLGEVGLSSREVYYTNAVRCRPPENRDPTAEELRACRHWLRREIATVRPEAILCVGKIARKSVVGLGIDVPIYDAWHPAFVMRQSSKKRDEWRNELQTIVDGVRGRPLPQRVALDPWAEGEPYWAAPALAVDTETDSLTEAYGERLVSVQVSDGQWALFASLQREPTRVDALLARIRGRHVYLWNAKYDAPLLGVDLLDADKWDDPALMAYVLRYERVGLKEIGPKLTGLMMEPITGLLTGYVKTEKTFKSGPRKGLTIENVKKYQRPFSQALREEPERARNYGMLDAVVTARAARILEQELNAVPTLRQYYDDYEKPMVPILGGMEQRGVKVDVAALEALSATLSESERRSVEGAKAIFDVPDRVNLLSPEQVAKVLQGQGFRWNKTTPTGRMCADEQVLLDLAGYTVYDDEKFGEGLKQAIEGDPEGVSPVAEFVFWLLNLRETRKLRGTYVDRLLRDRDAEGRIHARFNGMVTNTDRLSSSDPNLQNIPIRGTLRDAIRRVFVPREGCLFVKADKGQLEVRIYAHYTQETALLEAFRSGGDPHQAVADELGIPRWRAKNVLFAAIYGANAKKLAETAGVEGERARQFLERLRKRLPGMANWHPWISAALDSRGYVETLCGWRGYYPLWRSPLSRDRAEALREAGNLPIQGSASGIVKRTMIASEHGQNWPTQWHGLLRPEAWAVMFEYPRGIARHFGADLVLQVHDEVVYEVPEHAAVPFARALQTLGEGVAADLTVPLEFEPAVGTSWAELQKI
jgi:uracil-DNA glycosylase family 4